MNSSHIQFGKNKRGKSSPKFPCPVCGYATNNPNIYREHTERIVARFAGLLSPGHSRGRFEAVMDCLDALFDTNNPAMRNALDSGLYREKLEQLHRINLKTRRKK